MLANETTAGNLAALSRRLKTPKNTLWLWYRGEVLPSLEASLNICYHFNLSLADFFTGEMKENPENQVAKLMDKPGFLRYTEVRLALKLARIDSESATTD